MNNPFLSPLVHITFQEKAHLPCRRTLLAFQQAVVHYMTVQAELQKLLPPRR